MCGAPDRRSPLAALAQPPSDTTHVSVTKPPTPALPPLLVLIQSPSPYYPMPRLPHPPCIPARAFRTLQVLLPVNNTFCFISLSAAYTGPVIHCPHCAPSIRPPSSRPVYLVLGLVLKFLLEHSADFHDRKSSRL